MAAFLACVSLLVPAILLPRAGTSPRAVTAKNGIPGRPLITYESTRYGISLSVLKSIDEISAEEWDACALGASAAAGSGENPTVTHGFLHALEASRSVDASEGWMPQHLVAHDTATGQLLGTVPLYLKSHSYGEYVFDHAWARQYRAVIEDGAWSKKARSTVESRSGGGGGGSSSAAASSSPAPAAGPGTGTGAVPGGNANLQSVKGVGGLASRVKGFGSSLLSNGGRGGGSSSGSSGGSSSGSSGAGSGAGTGTGTGVNEAAAAPFRRQRPDKDVGYYPKLQAAVPFTPVTGPRILIGACEPMRRDQLHRVLARGLIALSERLGVSSVHVTFATKEEAGALSKHGFLPRIGLQYHWHNDGYKSFDDYLSSLKQSRRKAIRQERRKVSEAGVSIQRLVGDEITTEHWDAFYKFYSATVQEKWGRGYLTRDFFDRLGGAMDGREDGGGGGDARGADESAVRGSSAASKSPQPSAARPSSSLKDRVMLVLAVEESSGELIAGALNLIGDDCVYGRHWGCIKRYDSLHFELCYYQAVEAAIELGLPRVEAGAQGDHKLARGYLPTLTYSSHYLRHPSFKRAVSTFLRDEREKTYIALATIASEKNPFKADPAEHLRRQGLRIEGKRILVE